MTPMPPKVLILGSTGKMGTALRRAFADGFLLAEAGRGDFDAADSAGVCGLIEKHRPDIVINCIALLGIDACELAPDHAFRLNALYPKLLAELSREMDFILVHFSTDAVFGDGKRDYYLESDAPAPLNVYGRSKAEGDEYVRTIALRHYLVRVSLLFGPSSKGGQFAEKMLAKIAEGNSRLQIADDIILSPSYSLDVAYEIRRVLESSSPFGLYHIANGGKASLWELMREMTGPLYPGAVLEPVSWRTFPAVGIKNTCTPLASEKLAPLRPWTEAVREYCATIAAPEHP